MQNKYSVGMEVYVWERLKILQITKIKGKNYEGVCRNGNVYTFKKEDIKGVVKY